MASTEDAEVEKAAIDCVEDVEVHGEAKKAAQAQHDTTVCQAFRSNWKAAMWSAIISLTIIMEGYDVGKLFAAGKSMGTQLTPVGLIYQFFAYPSFAKTFGDWDAASNSYQVSGAWQAALSNGANCGIVIGGEAVQHTEHPNTDESSRLPEWHPITQIRLQESCPGLALRDELAHLLALLRQLSTGSFDGSNLVRVDLGCVRNIWTCLCFRGLSSGIARIPHLLRESLLGHRTTDRCWRFVWSLGPPRKMELSSLLCPSMGLADTIASHHTIRSRISMVFGTQKSCGGCSQGTRKTGHGGSSGTTPDCRSDSPHAQARGGNGVWHQLL